mmetsp:Transcript_66171/g.123506  ORF Transcript_66171/g.123506 Transcript_66171/m.123506 type:complete len:552 (+) Transcript_66171:100-1755(+)
MAAVVTAACASCNERANGADRKSEIPADRQVGWVVPTTSKPSGWRLRNRPSVLDLEGPSVLKQVLMHAMENPADDSFSRNTTESTHCDFESASHSSASSRSGSPERQPNAELKVLPATESEKEAQNYALMLSRAIQHMSVGRLPSFSPTETSSCCLPQVPSSALRFCGGSRRLLEDKPQLEASSGPWHLQTQADEVRRQGQRSLLAGRTKCRRSLDTSAEAPAHDLSSKELRGRLTEAKTSITSLAGTKPLPNQDRASMIRMANGAELLAVFDGHGEQGHLVADFCAQHLPEELLEGLAGQVKVAAGREIQPDDVVASWKESTKAAFAAMQEVLEEATVCHLDTCQTERPETLPRMDARCSGTTATVAVVQSDGSALLAHVGDSKAVIGTRRRCASMFQSNPWQTRDLTVDHKAKLEVERQRVLEAGAVVVSTSGGSQRIVSRGQFWPAINMTRSLGDLHTHTQGVIATPAVTFEPRLWHPTTEEAIMIIASDGLWDVMTPEECVKLAAQFPPSEASSALAKEALGRWKRDSRASRSPPHSDDITVVVKFL